MQRKLTREIINEVQQPWRNQDFGICEQLYFSSELYYLRKTIDIFQKMILRENTCKQKKHKQVI